MLLLPVAAMRAAVVFAALVGGLCSGAAPPPFAAPKGHVDSSHACVSVFGAVAADSVESGRIAAWLVAEVNSRLPLGTAPKTPLGWAAGSCNVSSPLACSVKLHVGAESSMPPGSFAIGVRSKTAAAAAGADAGAGAAATSDGDGAAGVVILLAAADLTGLRAGVGRLLRELHMPPRAGAPGAAPVTASTLAVAAAAASLDGADAGAAAAADAAAAAAAAARASGPFALTFGVSVPESLAVAYDPARDARWAMRGHQIATNSHTFQFRTLPEFQQFARDLVAFGTTLVEMGHVRLPLNVDDLAAFADATADAGLQLSVWGGSDSWSQNYTASAEARRGGFLVV
jgi:hypothetical protein